MIKLKSLINEEDVRRNPLDGKTKVSAKNYIYNKIIKSRFNGIFHDSFWSPIQDFFKEIRAMGIDFEVNDQVYTKDERGNPSSKKWYCVVSFKDKLGKVKYIQMTVTAFGAGSVKDPLDRYDVTVTMD